MHFHKIDQTAWLLSSSVNFLSNFLNFFREPGGRGQFSSILEQKEVQITLQRASTWQTVSQTYFAHDTATDFKERACDKQFLRLILHDAAPQFEEQAHDEQQTNLS